MFKRDLTHERLRNVLRYEPSSGDFKRIHDARKGRGKAGDVVGWDNGQGYIVVAVDGIDYRAHRLAHLYMTGEWPPGEVDHLNGVRSDNRWQNLRAVTSAENTQNQRRPHRNNSSGFLGVKRLGKKFGAFINVNRQRLYLGVFETAESAHEAYVLAKRKLHRSCTI